MPSLSFPSQVNRTSTESSQARKVSERISKIETSRGNSYDQIHEHMKLLGSLNNIVTR